MDGWIRQYPLPRQRPIPRTFAPLHTMIVWLASYPRSGNTFLRTVLKQTFGRGSHSIYGDTHDIAADRDTREMVGHLELPSNFDFEEARNFPEPIFIKTHEPFQGMDARDRALYIIRNGLAATTSYIHYLRTFSPHFFTPLEVINGHPFADSWARHVLSWQSADPDRVRTLCFEDVIKNPGAAIQSLQETSGLSPISNEVPTFQNLHTVNPAFFRKGETAGEPNSLTPLELAYFQLINGHAMAEKGYESVSAPSDTGPKVEEARLLALHVGLESGKALLRQKNQDTGSQHSQLARVKEKVRSLASENDRLRARNRRLEADLDSLYSSKTFRITEMLNKMFR